jgi:hypothetical protein
VECPLKVLFLTHFLKVVVFFPPAELGVIPLQVWILEKSVVKP